MFQLITDLLPQSLMNQRGYGRTAVRRLWWKCLRLVSPTSLFRVPVGGFRMWADPLDPIVSHCLMKYGYWEPAESELLKAILRTGDVFVDCGANIGYYTMLGARLVGGTGLVYAFEAIKENYDILVMNAELLAKPSSIHAHHIALGKEPGSLTIYRDQGNGGGHSLDPRNVHKLGAASTVPMDRLDALIPSPRVDVIKIDTQGSEFSILQGAVEILRRDRPVLLLEWWPYGLKNHGGAEGLARFLQKLGYECGLLQEELPLHLTPLSWDALIQRYDSSNPQECGTLICTGRQPIKDLVQSFTSAAPKWP